MKGNGLDAQIKDIASTGGSGCMSGMGVSIGKAELLMMTVFTSGCIVDHITTFYGLSLPTIVEVNPVVLMLIGSGVWHVVEVLIIAAGIFSGLVASSSKSRILIAFSMISLAMVGLVRLYAGIHNIVLISNIASVLELSSTII